MTILSGAQGGALNLNTLNVAKLFTHSTATVSESEAIYSVDADSFTELIGTNLTFNAAKEPTGGTATQLLHHVNGVLSLQIGGMNVSAAALYDLAESGDRAGFLQLILSGSDFVRGTDFRDSLLGLSGNDVLRGLGGKDTLDGGEGNDTLNGGLGADSLIGGAGLDVASYQHAAAGVKVSLTSVLTRTGEAMGDSFDSIEGLTGSGFADELRGNATGNVLAGGGGNDLLLGLTGKDTITGGGGADTITGGAASDVLSGGSGADLFIYLRTADSGFSTSLRDTITDFAPGVDTIDLSAIDAITTVTGSSFTFIGEAAFSAAGQVRLQQSGSDTILQANVFGSSGAEFTIVLTGVTAATVTGDDFVL